MSNRRIENIIVHWSASGPKTTVAQVRAWHLEKGYRDIGYHRMILHPQATERKLENLEWWDLVKLGRGLNADPFLSDFETGAHTYGFNKNSIGICVVGSPKYPLHPLQAMALRETIAVLCKRYGLPYTAVKCHRDFNHTECPGDTIAALVKQMSTPLTRRRPTP